LDDRLRARYRPLAETAALREFTEPMPHNTPTDSDYQRLLEFRTRLRQFLRWSEAQARSQDLTAAQHQLMLAIRGHPGPTPPSIGDVAGYLLLQHHSAVGLVDRAEQAGLVQRTIDPRRRNTVRLSLTAEGARRLEALSELHLREVPRLAATMRSLFAGLEERAQGSERAEQDPAVSGHGRQRTDQL
jgi:DNA-binding MarR family transcriptional regulator